MRWFGLLNDSPSDGAAERWFRLNQPLVWGNGAALCVGLLADAFGKAYRKHPSNGNPRPRP
jgi:hypothetical protein